MPASTVLIIEDDPDILHLVEINLEAAGIRALTADEGQEGLNLARTQHPDLIVLDIMLPDIDGFEVCRELKRDRRTTAIPVIMLTARSQEVDRIVGLELGADDYVVKPFSPRELLLRIRAVLKRAAPAPEPDPERENCLEHLGLRVDVMAHTVTIDDAELGLTATEFKLLAELLRRKGRVCTREGLLNSVWGYEFEGYARTVDTHIRRLRQKLGHYAEAIETLRGVGYRFRA